MEKAGPNRPLSRKERRKNAKAKPKVTAVVETYLQPEHMQAIGHVAAQSSTLEMFLDLAICGILDIPQSQVRALTSRHSSHNRLEVLGSLVDESIKSREARGRFVKLAKRISNCLVDRNNVVHATWLGTDSPEIVLRAKYTGRGKSKFVTKRMTAADIESVAKEISRTSGELYAFMLEHELLKSSPDS